MIREGILTFDAGSTCRAKGGESQSAVHESDLTTGGFLEEAVFTSVHAHTVSFPNPIRDGESSGTVYVAVCQEQTQKSGL